jgi:hypothetical protein
MRWCSALLDAFRPEECRGPLRAAGVAEDLTSWTRLMTDAVAAACIAMNWVVAAKGHKLELLPQAGQEYLSLDGMAFDPVLAKDGARWQWPVAIFELENKHTDDRTAYSLWKVLNVAAPLRVVVAYRRTWDEANALPGVLSDSVIRATMPVERWNAIEGEVLLVIGSRSDGDSFPWDYFRFWRFDRGIGRFARAGG